MENLYELIAYLVIIVISALAGFLGEGEEKKGEKSKKEKKPSSSPSTATPSYTTGEVNRQFDKDSQSRGGFARDSTATATVSPPPEAKEVPSEYGWEEISPGSEYFYPPLERGEDEVEKSKIENLALKEQLKALKQRSTSKSGVTLPALDSPEKLRQAVVLKEILGPPKAFELPKLRRLRKRK